MKLSKYVKEIVYDQNNVVLYNAFNGGLYYMPKRSLEEIKEEKKNEHYDILVEECFLVEQENVPHQVRANDFVVIVIEVSNECNLKCTYCYENDKFSRGVISDEVVENIYLYIRNVAMLTQGKRDLGIRFIGGEPLLRKEKLLEIAERIQWICDEFGQKVFFSIDTNGTIPFDDVYQAINHLSVFVTLSGKKDHNSNRPSDSFDSFERIVANLKKIKAKKDNSISVRYNTNAENVKEFPKFVEFVKMELPICKEIKTMYTDEYKYNSFKNGMTLDEFRKWNSSEAIDVLIQNGFPVMIGLGGELTICEAYQDYSCKIYLDGKITICDSMFHDKAQISIFDVSKDPNVLEEHFSQYRRYDPMTDIECAQCINISRCRGKLFCREEACQYDKRIDEEVFIKTYVRYCLEGKSEFFRNM